MNKYVLPFFCFLIMSSNSIAQDSLAYLNNKSNGITNPSNPVFIIKSEDFKRFPAATFLEAVEGMFPWVFGAEQMPSDFTYVINGRLLADIAGINLNDIEEIAFTRNNLYGGLFPFSNAGTFFITTKMASAGKLFIHFTSQFNFETTSGKPFVTLNRPANSIYPIIQANDISNKLGNYAGSHLSLSQSSKKISWYAAGYFNHNKLPGASQDLRYQATADTATKAINDNTSKGSREDYGLLINFEYRLSEKLQAGLSINYAHRQIIFDSTNSHFGKIDTNTQIGTINSTNKTLSISAYLKWTPLTNVSNIFSVEYIKNSYLSDTHITTLEIFANTPTHYNFHKTGNFNNEGILIRDELEYKMKDKGRLKISAFLNGLWFKPDFAYHYNSALTSDNSTNNNEYFRVQGLQKIAVVNPALQFSYLNFVSCFAGAGYLIGNKQFSDIKTAEKINPYAGLNINLKQLLSYGKGPDVLNLSFNYAKLAINGSFEPLANKWLPYANGLISTVRYTSASDNQVMKNDFMALQLTAGLLKNRLLISTEWSLLTFRKIFYVITTNYFNTYSYVSGIEKVKGVSVVISGKVIDQKQLKLFSCISFYAPEKNVEPNIYDPTYLNESSLKAGIQNKLVYKNFFFQLNALLRFNSPYPTNVQGETEKKNDFVINNLLIGCNFPSAKGILKNSVLFFQARNLYVSDPLKQLNYYNKFAGIGIELSL